MNINKAKKKKGKDKESRIKSGKGEENAGKPKK